MILTAYLRKGIDYLLECHYLLLEEQKRCHKGKIDLLYIDQYMIDYKIGIKHGSTDLYNRMFENVLNSRESQTSLQKL